MRTASRARSVARAQGLPSTPPSCKGNLWFRVSGFSGEVGSSHPLATWRPWGSRIFHRLIRVFWGLGFQGFQGGGFPCFLVLLPRGGHGGARAAAAAAAGGQAQRLRHVHRAPRQRGAAGAPAGRQPGASAAVAGAGALAFCFAGESAQVCTRPVAAVFPAV